MLLVAAIVQQQLPANLCYPCFDILLNIGNIISLANGNIRMHQAQDWPQQSKQSYST